MGLKGGATGEVKMPTIRPTLFQAGGFIAVAGTPQLLLPPGHRRSYIAVYNTSAAELRLGLGGARGKATISGGAVNAVSVANAGMGYTKPPNVIFFGGIGGGLGFQAPSDPNVATAHANLSGATIGTITVDQGGAGYTAAPDVLLQNQLDDTTGSFAPGTTQGITLAAGASWIWNPANLLPLTEALSIWGGTINQTFECSFLLA